MADGDSGAAATAGSLPSLLQSALPGIISRAKVVVSPYPFATADDDMLRVTVVNSLPNVAVEVHGRLVTRNGEQNPFRFVVGATSNRVALTRDFSLAGGFVSNLSAFASGAAPTQGQTFVIVQIVRGSGVAAFVLGTLLSSYVTATQPIGWPGTPIENSLEGKGCVRLIDGTSPAMNAEVNEAVPSGARWRLVYFQALLTTSAVALDRAPRLSFNVGSPAFIHLPICNTVPASKQRYCSWFEGAAFNSDHSTNVSSGSLPASAILTAGQVVATNTENLSAGDQYSNVTYAVEEWIDV